MEKIPVGNNSQILNEGDDIERIVLKNDMFQINGKSTRNSKEPNFDFNPQGGMVNPCMSNLTHMITTNSSKVDIGWPNIGIKVNFEPSRGWKGP
jgi:hypothetical protein